MANRSNAAALRVLPDRQNPAPMPAPSAGGLRPEADGTNNLRAVSDYGPIVMHELDEEIAGYLEKIDKLQLQRFFLSRLVSFAQEYCDSRE